MKYDDASWHYGGNFPDDLPPSAGATHSGMFLTWAILAGLGGELHTEEYPEDFDMLLNRTTTPGEFLIDACDEKFTNEDLNEEGNAFAAAYFDMEKGDFITDYEELLAEDLPSTYHVADTWENFDKLKPVLDSRLEEWRSATGKNE